MRTYSLTAKWKAIYVITIIFMSVLEFFVLFSMTNWSRFGFIGGLVFGLWRLILHLLFLPKVHLTLSEGGISYRGLERELKVSWDALTTPGRYLTREGFFLEKEKVTGNSFTMTTFKGLGRRIFLPISCFASDWRSSELGNQIRQHAPVGVAPPASRGTGAGLAPRADSVP